MQMIASDNLAQAIKALQNLLKGSPAYTEIIMHSARYNAVMKAIRMGTINLEDGGTEKNKIRYAVMDMVRELEEGVETDSKLRSEIEAMLEKGNRGTSNTITITGDENRSINVQGVSGSNVQLNINRPSSENADE